MEYDKLYSKKYLLTAGECNPELEMPVPLLVTRLIEIATLHANSWGVGYANLIKYNEGWVLSRVTLEMKRYPKVNEGYTISTWIEGYNRRFSMRNMEITGTGGEVLGYARTIWMAMNFTTRGSADLSNFSYMENMVSDKPCPIAPQGRLAAVNEGQAVDYVFKYVDCDFNRHVNTVRYIEHFLNMFSLEKFDKYMVSRLEVAFLKETKYGSEAKLMLDDSNKLDCKLAVNVDGGDHSKARIVFVERQQ